MGIRISLTEVLLAGIFAELMYALLYTNYPSPTPSRPLERLTRRSRAILLSRGSMKSIAKAVYASPAVREHALDLLKVIVGVVLAHYGIKYS